MCHEDNNGTDYAYTDAGRLETRTWQRGVITTYGYDNGGRLETVDYTNETNGHTTPDLVNTYDTLGRLRTVTRGGVLHAETTYRLGDLQRHLDKQQIDTLNQSVSYTYEDGTNGTLAGRPNGYTFADGTAVWGFDNAGRLAAVADTTDNFNYGYRYTPDGTIHRGVLPSEAGTQSHMPFSLVGPQVETTLAYENTRNALAYRENKIPSGPLSKFSYTVNGIEQRDSLTPTGSAFSINTPFSWGYNQRGELTTANRTGNATFERSYSYDGIGNRLSATDHTGSDTNYFADAGATTAGGNALNQYAKINYPGSTTIEPQHDTDGNMETGPVPGVNGLSPGVPIPANATLTWDAENRLVKAVLTSITVEYAYDHQSRLISRTVGSLTTRYLYDGWNRIAEYESNGTGHTLKRTYLWGMDLSGSMQGAGGVGGLLSMTVHDTTSATFYPTYDGNGNVSEYVDENGDKAAHFEYDPFGNLTVDSESNAGDFPYRFSTKPQDLTTGLYYYGYRWYDPATGRWPTRDPIGEQGGVNLYGMVSNNPINVYDVFGLQYVTYLEALDAATREVGTAAMISREKGKLELSRYFFLKTLDSPHYARFEHSMLHPYGNIHIGLAGREFGAMVLCDPSPEAGNKRYEVSTVYRGDMPKQLGGDYPDGSVFLPIDMAEEVTNKKVVATLHSHTHNSFLIAPDTSILPIFPKQNFPPINNGFIDILGLQPANTPPSGPDKAFAAHFSDIDHFVVHEFYLAQWYYRFQIIGP